MEVVCMEEDQKRDFIKGLTRDEYFSNRLCLNDFHAVENRPEELLHWIMSVANATTCHNTTNPHENFKLGQVWQDHVLVVLVEILHVDIAAVNEEFVCEINATEKEKKSRYLKQLLGTWKDRLDRYIRGQWSVQNGIESDDSIRAAHSICQQLEGVLINSNPPWARMLQVLRNIHRRSNGYILMIEKGGNLDPALALLLIFIRNYGAIVGRFNAQFQRLSEFYHKEILHTKDKKVVQDSMYIVVTPEQSSFSLPKGFAFSVEQDGSDTERIYRTIKSEWLTTGRIDKISSVFCDHGDKENQLLLSNDVLSCGKKNVAMFDKKSAETVSSGWQLESQMFSLSEGNRRIGITFCSDANSLFSQVKFDKTAFFIEVSTEKAWVSCTLDDIRQTNEGIRIDFTIDDRIGALSPCTEDVHGGVTEYPCIRFQTSKDNYPGFLADVIRFDDVKLDIVVDGIRNFRLRNVLGDADSTQSFMPFGVMGERGAWFSFGHDELDCLPLTEVRLNVQWDKLPQSSGGYADIYKNYNEQQLTNASFHIATSYRVANDWIKCKDSPSPLFIEHDNVLSDKRCISFAIDTDSVGFAPQECSFRVMLDGPEIGFGVGEYQRRFAEVMMHNVKNKKQQPVPHQPVVPIFSEMSLSYHAQWCRKQNRGIGLKLSKINLLGELVPCPLPAIGDGYCMLENSITDKYLYIRFVGLSGERRIRLYVALAFVDQDFWVDVEPRISKTDLQPALRWEYQCGGYWKVLGAEKMLQEETDGLRKNGYIEFFLPDGMNDCDESFSMRVRIEHENPQCLALDGLYLNCILVQAENGTGSSIPAGSLKKSLFEESNIASIWQPFPSFGGSPAEDVDVIAKRRSGRIAHRYRAVSPKDYEQLILEQFPSVEKVHCLPRTEQSEKFIHIVVFSHTEGVKYPFTPAWLLAEIERWVTSHISAFARVKVCNPEYHSVDITCRATLKEGIFDDGSMRHRLCHVIEDYFAPWIKIKGLPELGKLYSYKELYMRIMNVSGVDELLDLSINGVNHGINMMDIRESHDFLMPDASCPAWTVLIPKIDKLELLPFDKAVIDEAVVDVNFKIQ